MNVLCFHTLRNESTDRLRPFCDLGQMVLLQTLNIGAACYCVHSGLARTLTAHHRYLSCINWVQALS